MGNMPRDVAKRIRNAVVRIPGAQTLIKTAIRAGLLPIAVSSRLQPLGSHWLTAPDGARFRYISDSTDQLARSLIWRGLGDWEETTIPVFYELARSARSFLDIGAYSGIYTLLGCAANAQLQVIAFEPNPRSRLLLERNIDANLLGDRVTVEHAAAGEHDGRAILRVPANETAASILCDEGSPINVSVVSIDDVVPAELPVDLAKIDVEGAEPDVLKGMRRVLTRDHPSLIVECLSSQAFASVRRLLEQHGYRRFGYLGPRGLESADKAVEPLPCYANFLCRP